MWQKHFNIMFLPVLLRIFQKAVTRETSFCHMTSEQAENIFFVQKSDRILVKPLNVLPQSSGETDPQVDPEPKNGSNTA